MKKVLLVSESTNRHLLLKLSFQSPRNTNKKTLKKFFEFHEKCDHKFVFRNSQTLIGKHMDKDLVVFPLRHKHHYQVGFVTFQNLRFSFEAAELHKLSMELMKCLMESTQNLNGRFERLDSDVHFGIEC